MGIGIAGRLWWCLIKVTLPCHQIICGRRIEVWHDLALFEGSPGFRLPWNQPPSGLNTSCSSYHTKRHWRRGLGGRHGRWSNEAHCWRGPIAVGVKAGHPATTVSVSETFVGVAVPLAEAQQSQIVVADGLEQFVQEHGQFGHALLDRIQFWLFAQLNPLAAL